MRELIAEGRCLLETDMERLQRLAKAGDKEARRELERAKRQRGQYVGVSLSAPIDSLPVPWRIRNGFAGSGLSLGDLLPMSEREVLKTGQVGRAGLRLLKGLLFVLGHKWHVVDAVSLPGHGLAPNGLATPLTGSNWDVRKPLPAEEKKKILAGLKKAWG